MIKFSKSKVIFHMSLNLMVLIIGMIIGDILHDSNDHIFGIMIMLIFFSQCICFVCHALNDETKGRD